MKHVGKYVRECCGKRLPGRYQFCPVCGAKAERPKPDEAGVILMEIDRRARTSETCVRKAQERLHQIDAGELGAPTHFDSLRAFRRVEENTMNGHAKSALWYRTVERLITDLLTRKSI